MPRSGGGGGGVGGGGVAFLGDEPLKVLQHHWSSVKQSVESHHKCLVICVDVSFVINLGKMFNKQPN